MEGIQEATKLFSQLKTDLKKEGIQVYDVATLLSQLKADNKSLLARIARLENDLSELKVWKWQTFRESNGREAPRKSIKERLSRPAGYEEPNIQSSDSDSGEEPVYTEQSAKDKAKVKAPRNPNSKIVSSK